MTPPGVLTPAWHLAVCSEMRPIVIKTFFLFKRTTRCHAQAALYKTEPPIVSRIFA
jgi:hypothetical protein